MSRNQIMTIQYIIVVHPKINLQYTAYDLQDNIRWHMFETWGRGSTM